MHATHAQFMNGKKHLTFRPPPHGRKRRTTYVRQSSHSHRIPRQRRRRQNHQEPSFLHRAVASDQAQLEESRTGERQSETTWHRCIVWAKLGEYAATLTKGAHVQIEGEIRTREYTQKGTGKKAPDVKKSITEVRVTSIHKLDRAHAPGNSAPEGRAAQEVAA